MPVKISSNFQLNTPKPLDNRLVTADLTSRDLIPAIQRYLGMIVYVLSNQKRYILRNGVTNLDWEVIASATALNKVVTVTAESSKTIAWTVDDRADYGDAPVAVVFWRDIGGGQYKAMIMSPEVTGNPVTSIQVTLPGVSTGFITLR